MSLISKLPAGLYWRTVRKVMPAQPVSWAGVNSHLDRKWFDDVLLPDRFTFPRDRPNYENALIFGLKESVRKGDSVTIIGGGYGITAVVASQLAGSSGSILVYEGSGQQLAICRSVLERNETPAPVRLEHAIVGQSIGVYGGHDGRAAFISAQGIADCDVLQMDCEGSELGILHLMNIRPRAIIVETHGFLGASTQEVKSTLCGLNYIVDDLGLAEIDSSRTCVSNDIRVLFARRAD